MLGVVVLLLKAAVRLPPFKVGISLGLRRRGAIKLPGVAERTLKEAEGPIEVWPQWS